MKSKVAIENNPIMANTIVSPACPKCGMLIAIPSGQWAVGELIPVACHDVYHCGWQGLTTREQKL